jgi:hypothetical protein
MYCYKIVDKDAKGNYKTLFHGVDGSRVMPVGSWVRSEQKTVRDGSSGTEYTSGWHVLLSLTECKRYLSKFKKSDEKVIVKVNVKGSIWPKEHSPSNVYLCEYIMIVDEI